MDAVGSVVAVVVGFLLKTGSDLLLDFRVSSKEGRRRKADSQRETLLALQGCLLQLDRASGAALRANPLQLQPLAHPVIATLSAEDQALEDAVRSSTMVRVRIDDSELRGLVLEFEQAATAAAKPPAPDQSVPLSEARRDAFNKANERLGELLRSLK